MNELQKVHRHFHKSCIYMAYIESLSFDKIPSRSMGHNCKFKQMFLGSLQLILSLTLDGEQSRFAFLAWQMDKYLSSDKPTIV